MTYMGVLKVCCLNEVPDSKQIQNSDQINLYPSRFTFFPKNASRLYLRLLQDIILYHSTEGIPLQTYDFQTFFK